MDKIFINIASYRDPSLIKTIKEAMFNAKYPQRLVFGIGLQYYDDEMPDLSFIPDDQIKTIKYRIDNRPGLVKIRYEISQLVTDEDYFLMIDSHTMFGPHWDEKIISEYNDLSNSLNTRSFVFSFAFNVLHHGKDFNMSGRYAIFDQYPLEIWYEPVHNPIKTEKYKNAKAVTCSSFFAPIIFLKDVGLDQYSQFFLEEHYLAWRTYMCGWDIYVPKTTWICEDSEKKSLYIKHAWNDDWSIGRHKSTDSDEDKISMIISMFTNLPGKYSIENNKNNVNSFFDSENTLSSIKYFKNVNKNILTINKIINGYENHPINDKLIYIYVF